MDKQRQIKRQNDYIRQCYDKVTLALPKGSKDRIKARAAGRGQSLTQYIMELVEEDFQKN